MASLKKNIIANYIGRSWTALLAILLIPVYIKFMGVEAYGLVGFFTALTSIMGILDLGIGSTMTRELARRSTVENLIGSQRDLVRTLEIIYWGITFFVGAVVIIGAPFISNTWINTEELSPGTVLRAVQFMAISVALRFPMSLYQGGLMGLQKQVLVNIILVANGTLRGLGAVLVLWLISPTIEAFFIWQGIVSLIGSILFFVAMWANLPKSQVNPKFNKNILMEIWKFSAAISVNAFIGVILSQLDKIILSTMLSLKTFAYYSIATTVASSIWLILLPFNNAIYPRLVQLFEMNQIDDIKVIFHQFSQVLSLLLVPISAILIIFSSEILLLWMKDPIIVENTHLLMSILVFGIMLNGITSIPGYCSIAFNWPMLVTYTNAIQAIIIIPLIIFLVNLYEAKGAAIAWVLMNSTYILIMIPIFFRRFLRQEMKSWYLKDIGLPISIAFIIGFISKLLSPPLNTSVIIFIWLLVTGIVSIFITSLSLSHVRNGLYFWFKSRILK